MWYYRNNEEEILAESQTLPGIIEAFLKYNKNILQKMGGGELSVHYLKTSKRDMRFMKSFYVEFDEKGSVYYDWIFTRIEQSLVKNTETWVLDFLAFGMISNSNQELAKYKWVDWWNRIN